jgi:hypothetical protein
MRWNTLEVAEVNNELHFTTPEEFRLAMNEKDMLKIVQKVAGRPMRVRTTFGETNGSPGRVISRRG